MKLVNLLIEMMNNEKPTKAPIIALTTDDCEENTQKCYQNELVAHLMKPIRKHSFIVHVFFNFCEF